MRAAGWLHGIEKRFVDVGLDLAAEAEDEAAARERLQVIADVGEQHRVASERDRDARAELDGLRVLRGEQQREERVVTGLRSPDAAVASLLGFLRRLAGLAEIETDASVNLHGGGR